MLFNLHIMLAPAVQNTKDSCRWRCHFVFIVWIFGIPGSN